MKSGLKKRVDTQVLLFLLSNIIGVSLMVAVAITYKMLYGLTLNTYHELILGFTIFYVLVFYVTLNKICL